MAVKAINKNWEYCKGCGHYRPFEYNNPNNRQSRNIQQACHYILDTGFKRSCPAGKDCVHYTEEEFHSVMISE